MPILRVGVRQISALNRTAKGFSLIEALLVTVIVGLLLAVITPVFTSGYRGIVLKSTVRSVAASLRYVRATAIGNRKKSVLEFDLQNKSFSSAPLTQKSAQSQKVAEFITLYEPDAGPFVNEEEMLPVVFEFFPSGGSNGRSLVFAYQRKRYLIEISPLTGKVKVSGPTEFAKSLRPKDASQ